MKKHHLQPIMPLLEAKVERRERVFMILAAVFWSCMTMLNIMGITRFVELGGLAVAVGVLPYPLTFLCTDLISEFYGKSRANFVVWVGLGLNFVVIGVVYVGWQLSSVAPESQPPWQTLFLAKDVILADGTVAKGSVQVFQILYACTVGSVFASMLSYIAAQFCDVYLYHFWKDLTQGRHLWLRNNGSTMISQIVDSVMVIGITFGAVYWRGDMTLPHMLELMGSNYIFKFLAALVDTIPMYLMTMWLRRYLK